MPAQNDKVSPVEKHTTFYAVAYTHFLEAKRLAKERLRYEGDRRQEGPEWTDDDRDFVAVNSAAEERSSIVATIFSAVALEAFINDYAIIDKFSRGYVDKYLDRLTPQGKWLIFPLLHVGETFRTDGQTFQVLTELFRLRNQLVHFKTSKIGTSDLATQTRLNKEHASDAIRTVHAAVAELAKLDPRVSTRWLSEAEKAPVE